MFRIEAPYPSMQTTVILPSPNWGDSSAVVATVKTMRTMTGKLYTYRHAKGDRKKLHWAFQLSRNKALELEAFFQSYFGSSVRITDHEDNVWIGYFQTNPFELSGTGRALNFPGREIMDVAFDFEEAE
jgi:hypothetical protein